MKILFILFLVLVGLRSAVAPTPWPSQPPRHPIMPGEITPASPDIAFPSSSSPVGSPTHRDGARTDATLAVHNDHPPAPAEQPLDVVGISDRRKRLTRAKAALKTGAVVAGSNVRTAPMQSVRGLVGTYKEVNNAYVSALGGSIGQAAHHLACIPGRLGIGVLGTCASLVTAMAAVPAGTVTAVAQLALLAKDACNRRNEPNDAQVRRNRRQNNSVGSERFGKAVTRSCKSFNDKIAEHAAAVPHPYTSGRVGVLPDAN
jgi:hypothetical protein